jgi:YegS/Rv2252/BmrU family lipid kinase
MKSKKKILLVVNPIAGGTSKEPLLSLVKREAIQRDVTLSIFATTGKNDEAQLRKEIEQHRPQRVLVAGGDGTIKLVAEVLNGMDISVGILPAGSANGLATHFNIPDNQREQLEIALGTHTIMADRLLVNNKVCLHLADLGINAELIKNYERSQIRGKLGYILQSIPTLFKCEYPFTFNVTTETISWQKDGIQLAIANANKFGTGANINPKGAIDDGKFELVLFKKLDIIEIIKTIQSEIDLQTDFAETVSTPWAKIITKAPVPLQIDGEYMGEITEVEVSVCPHKLEIAIPQGFVSR